MQTHSETSTHITFEHPSPIQLKVILTGTITPADVDHLSARWDAEVRTKARSLFVLLDVSGAHPQGRASISAMANFLRDRTGVRRLAVSGIKGAKGLIFRLLSNLVGRFPYPLQGFPNTAAAQAWLFSVE